MRQLEKAPEETPGETRLAAYRNSWPLYAFLLGSAISYIGDILTLFAIPWFILQTTGSVTRTGITAFFSTVPMVCSAFFGGSLVDRLGRKHTSVVGDIASALTVMLIPLLHNMVGLAFWELLVLVFLGGLLKSPGVTARSSMVPELAELARMRLERVNALNDGVSRVSRFIGAPLAAVLIAVIGTSNLLWFDALSFAVSALLIGLAIPPMPGPVSHGRENEAYLKATARGMHFISHNSLILSMVTVVMVTNLLDAAYLSVVGPAYIRHVYNSVLPLGILSATLGGASFVGTMIFGVIGHRLPRRLTLSIGYNIGGPIRMWMLLVPNLPLVIGWNIIAGLGISSVNPLLDTILLERIPPEMRSRVLGTISAGALAGVPLGTLLFGYVVAWMGLQYTLVLMGACYMVATLSLLINPALRQMDERV